MSRRSAFGRMLALGFVSAGLMALSIWLRGENWNDRTIALLLIWAGSGFLGGGLGIIGLRWLERRGQSRLAGYSRGVLFMLGFLVAGAALYLLQHRLMLGFETPHSFVRWFIFGNAEVMAVFLYSAPHYLLPWLGPAMLLAGYALLPGAGEHSKG